MEFVVLLLLVNLVLSSYLIYQFSQLGKRFRGVDDNGLAEPRDRNHFKNSRCD